MTLTPRKPAPREIKPISAEYRQFVLEHAPRFARAVSRARQNGGDATITLRAFRDNPFLLYAALWYAATEGVAVTVTPSPTLPRHSAG